MALGNFASSRDFWGASLSLGGTKGRGFTSIMLLSHTGTTLCLFLPCHCPKQRCSSPPCFSVVLPSLLPDPSLSCLYIQPILVSRPAPSLGYLSHTSQKTGLVSNIFSSCTNPRPGLFSLRIRISKAWFPCLLLHWPRMMLDPLHCWLHLRADLLSYLPHLVLGPLFPLDTCVQLFLQSSWQGASPYNQTAP